MSWSREGDMVTLQITFDDWLLLLFLLGRCAGGETSAVWMWKSIALVNRLAAGNPDYTPYEIPQEIEGVPI